MTSKVYFVEVKTDDSYWICFRDQDDSPRAYASEEEAMEAMKFWSDAYGSCHFRISEFAMVGQTCGYHKVKDD